MDEPLLQMSGISKRFGATVALREVNLEVPPNAVMALIGENGAGKSTLMKILSGAHLADSGTMQLAGKPYRPTGPYDARLAGVGMIYQELNLAPHLNVEDNIMLGQERRRWGLLNRHAQRKLVREALEQLGHGNLPLDVPVQKLPIALQQIVEIARAIASQSKILIFDEPTSSLTGHDVRQLFEVIRKVKAAGIGVVYISHFLEEVREVCDCYAVLRDGASVGAGGLNEVTDSDIVAKMVGRSVDQLFPRVPHTPGATVLQVNGLSADKIPTEVSFDLRRGEILGIAGLVGAGRTELLRCLFALRPVSQGKVLMAERSMPENPRARIRAGLGYVSEDRKQEGLAQSRSIADNITYSNLGPFVRWGWLRLGRRRVAVEQVMQSLQIKARSQQQPVSELSGGNQQKVAIARVLHQDAEVLLLDEPTRGIDVGTKSEIYRLMGELAAAGKAVVFVSSYLPELLAVCDRIGVMARGRLRTVRPTREWTEEQIMQVATGAADGDEVDSTGVDATTKRGAS